MRLVALVLFLTACGGSSGTFDAGGGADLATSFCVGTELDGTCAQQFLGPLYACVQANGACTQSGSTTCWASGGEVKTSSSSSGSSVVGSQGGVTCFSSTQTGSSSSAYIISSSGGAGTLTLYPQTGKILCPDNRSITLTTSYGNCDAFRFLVTGPDTSSCTAGSCP